MSATTFIIHFHASEAKLSEFQEAMQQLGTELPKVNGCTAAAVYQDRDNNSRFTVVESWDSADEHQQHIETLVADGTWNQLAGLLRSEPSSSYFNPL
jgi:quinol monooxygenase YgiN